VFIACVPSMVGGVAETFFLYSAGVHFLLERCFLFTTATGTFAFSAPAHLLLTILPPAHFAHIDR
jgi:hypothetical protein